MGTQNDPSRVHECYGECFNSYRLVKFSKGITRPQTDGLLSSCRPSTRDRTVVRIQMHDTAALR
jgi:hypothetical protein